MVACIAMKGNVVVTPPSGWAAAATQQNSGDTDATDGIASAAMFYIVRGASAPDLTCTRTLGDVAYAKVISYSGGSATPLDTGTSATQGSAGNTPTTGTITTAEDGELIVAFVAYGDQYTVSAFNAATDPTTASGATDTTTAPTNGTWIERFDANTNTGADTGIGIADAVRSSAGSTGTIQATVSSASGRNVMMAAAFKLNHTFSQTSYRFYADGTENVSSALQNQDTDHTADVSGGDVNVGLRIRLQETAGSVGSATDDYQLQYELNDGATWVDVAGSHVIDSYDTANQNTVAFFLSSPNGQGESITGDGSKVGKAQFYVQRVGSPTGTAKAFIYAHSGTFGTSSLPTGAALATSDPVNMADPSTSLTLVDFVFSGVEQITLTNATNYVLTLEYQADGSTNGSNKWDVGVDSTSPTHAGNGMSRSTVTWSTSASDRIFFLYSTPSEAVAPYDSASLTDGNATTNRLGSGSGSFVAGEISEDGLVDNLQITASNYTELLYSLTIESTAVADNDTLDFRVLRNGATTGMTYTVTPRITIDTGGGAPATRRYSMTTLGVG